MKGLKKLWGSLCLAFSMYSRIPMPGVDWDPAYMEYVFCFFPAVGLVLGLCQLGCIALMDLLKLQGLLYPALLLCVSLAVTGGIHLDGLCDTFDALGAQQSIERRLEILKDPHIGAFGVMGLLCYLLLWLGLWQALEPGGGAIAVAVLIPTLSRCLSGLCCLLLKEARGQGLLVTFTHAAARGRVLCCLAFWLLVAVVFLLLHGWILTMTVLLGACLALLIFVPLARTVFGGITGDLAGWFLCICELACLFTLVLGQRILRLWC